MLNLDKIGVPFAKIIGGKYNDEVVSVSEDLTADKSFRYLGISNDAKFQLIPNEKTERERSSTSLDHGAVVNRPL